MTIEIADKLSPNFGDRREGKTPSIIILHYTDTLDAAQALQLMHNIEHEASAHYLIDEDGTITRLVDEKNRAWHAGKSFWRGETDINSISVGIEIQNPGHRFGYRGFPKIQMAAVEELCHDIMQRHGIQPENVLAHSDIAPGRKIDPGELFPWQWLADSGIGAWPSAPAPKDHMAADPETVAEKLIAYGYDPSVDAFTLISAFQRHFEPEVFQTPDLVGTPSSSTRFRIENLLKHKAV